MDNVEKLNKLANGKQSNWEKEAITLEVDNAANEFVEKHKLDISDKIFFIAGAQWALKNNKGMDELYDSLKAYLKGLDTDNSRHNLDSVMVRGNEVYTYRDLLNGLEKEPKDKFAVDLAKGLLELTCEIAKLGKTNHNTVEIKID